MLNKKQRLLLVAQRAMLGSETLPNGEKHELLLGIAGMLDLAAPVEAEAARLAAFTVAEADRQQMKFRMLLNPPAGAR